jgi:hypothetical protein
MRNGMSLFDGITCCDTDPAAGIVLTAVSSRIATTAIHWAGL